MKKNVQNNSTESRSRNTAMDILRVIACLFVVTLHSTADGLSGSWTSSKAFMVALVCVSSSGVPLFFLLSGAFSNNTTISKAIKKALYLFFLFILFKCLFAIWDCYFYYGKISFFNLYYNAEITNLTAYKGHLWYLPEFIVLTLVSPIINSAYKINRLSTLFLSILFIAFSIIRPISMPIPLGNGIKANIIEALLESIPLTIPNGIGYYCIGKTIFNYLTGIKKYLKQPSIIVIPLSILWILTNVITSIVSIKSSIIQGSVGYSSLSNTHIGIFLADIILFSLFSVISVYYDLKNHPALEIVVSCSLFIYLIHPLFIDILSISGFTSMTFNPVIAVPLKVCIVLIACLPSSYIAIRLHSKFKEIISIKCTNK